MLAAGLLSPAGAADEREVLRLATTTSTENSGLLGVLVPAFSAEHGIEVQTISVGTGKALRLLGNGDVDMSLTHARAAELEMVKKGLAIDRRFIMYNDFVLVGPPDDPAGLQSATSLSGALEALAASNAVFVSRGDGSGTHLRELELWGLSSGKPAERNYRETGQGMGKTLQISAEIDGYTLTDRGTWLAMRAKLPLRLVYQGDESLVNIYSVMLGNPAVYPELNHAAAERFSTWLQSERAQRLIGGFRVDGEPLFIPRLTAKQALDGRAR
ncbi:MAG: substrate-binding domain-containing protein [Gammaproteobacteria bacterium]|nr:substrate-binding domain-containing protein [Gammaproteobacteria bacterium]